MKLFRPLLWSQCIYTLLTALWPLLHIESFLAVTGPKTDIWLVKTVGAMLVPVSVTLGYYLFWSRDRRPALLLGALSSIAFASIDFYYALFDVIADVYLVDGVVQVFFLSAWVYLLFQHPSMFTGLGTMD